MIREDMKTLLEILEGSTHLHSSIINDFGIADSEDK